MRTIHTLVMMTVLVMTAFAQSPVALHEEDRELYDKFFDQAGAEFGVPAELLRGLSFSETRWTHMQWAADDLSSSCTGMPRVYGVMGLWDNEYFGHSLRDAARLIGRTPAELKASPLQNIRGAAALLKRYYMERPKPSGFAPGSIESWQNAIAAFSGFPQQDLAQRRGLEIYSVLSTGYDRDRIRIEKRSVDVERVRSYVQSYIAAEEAKHPAPKADNAASQPDYPLAKWKAAYSGNFGTTLIQQKFVVIHDVEGSYLGCISWFQNSTAVVSAHYVLNSHPNGVSGTSPNSTPDAPVGEVTQMVEEKYRAYHVGCWNSYMVGIEHEGYATVSGWYTTECFAASSKLVKYLCEKYAIPKDRNHVIAHQEWQNASWKTWMGTNFPGIDATCNTHTDPGVYWNWTNFMSLVNTADTIRPVITSSLPESDLSAFPAYKEITIGFNTPMDAASTVAAFSLTPSVAGTTSWNTDNTVLTFKSTAILPWSTVFTVKVDTSAKNVAKSRNLGTTPFVRNFTTVPLDTAGPFFAKTYPAQNETGVSLYGDVVLNMNEPVQTATLSTTVKLYDENNASVPLAGARNEVVMDKGIVSFVPTGLKPNKLYTMKLLPGVKDYYGNSTKTEQVFSFTTGPDVVTDGTPLDNLDGNTKGWLQPFQSANSLLVDTSKTKFTFTTEKVRVGASAKLTYAFTAASGGSVEVKASGYPPVDGYNKIGLWVSGDAGQNSIELHLVPGDQVLSLGKVYWRGWKFFQFPLTSVTGPNKILRSIVLRQENGGSTENKVYFDEVQLDAVVTAVREQLEGPLSDFRLAQNYPNPFNPGTMVEFSVPQTATTSLCIYDMLGREVAIVVNDVLPAGTYRQHIDASGLSSGMYFYTLRSGSYSMTRSMLLMK